MTIDKHSNLWVCFYREACIKVFNQNGKKKFQINFSAKNITNCAFGGKKNTDLFVTSALKGIKKRDLFRYNNNGSLFRLKTNIEGVKTKKFETIL